MKIYNEFSPLLILIFVRFFILFLILILILILIPIFRLEPHPNPSLHPTLIPSLFIISIIKVSRLQEWPTNQFINLQQRL